MSLVVPSLRSSQAAPAVAELAAAALAAAASASAAAALDKGDVQDDADERWESYGIYSDSDSDAQTSFD